MKKRIMSFMLTFTMVMSLFPGMAVTASAAETSNSHNHDGYTAVETIGTSLTGGSYSLSKDITANNIQVSGGTVNICLNGKILNVSLINVGSGATLNIYDCGSAVHTYKSSATGAWELNDSGDKTIEGGVVTGKITVDGTFNLCGGTLCGVSGGIAIHNKAMTTIGEDAAVMGNYNGASDSNAAAVVRNDKGAKFYNYGHIDQNVSRLHSVRNNGGIFYNYGSISNNRSTAVSDSDAGLTAGGVANYSLYTETPSEFYNYGKINENISKRSSGGVLNKVGQFYNYGQINKNSADRHCGGVDNTSRDSGGGSNTNTTFIKNYGQINKNKALGVHEGSGGGTGGGIYNEVDAKIYNYGEICGNEAKDSGAGIYYSTGELYVGLDSKVTGNTVGGNASNILLDSGKLIQMDKINPLTENAYMGVHLTKNKNNGPVTSGYHNIYPGVAVENYYFPDSDNQIVLLLDGREVYLVKKTITVEIADWEYGDEPSVPVVTRISGGGSVAIGHENCFYKVASADEYSNTVPTAIGEYTLKVMMGTDTGFATFKILPKEIMPTVELAYEKAEYTGKELKPSVIVKYGDKVLSSDEYTVKYDDNVKAGTATVTITTEGNYEFDKINATFEVLPKEIEPVVTLEYEEAEYTGGELEPDVTVMYGSEVLSPDEYTVKYDNNIEAGNATVTITTKGNYAFDEITKTFKIVRADNNEPTTPDLGTIVDLNLTDKSISVTATGDTVILNIPEDGFIYYMYAVPVREGMTEEDIADYIKTMVKLSVGEDILDAEKLNMADETTNNDYANDIRLWFSKEAMASVTKETIDSDSIVVAVKLDPANMNHVTYDSAEENPYFGSTDAYVYPIYGVYVELVEYKDISEDPGSDPGNGDDGGNNDGGNNDGGNNDGDNNDDGNNDGDNNDGGNNDGDNNDGDNDDDKNDGNNNESSGSKDSGNRTHTIKDTDSENGKVTIDRKQASKGSAVTITVVPDEGYELDKLTVTDSKGNELELTDNGDGTYTFEMPSGKVSVDANFVETFSDKADSDVKDCPKDALCPVDNFIDASTSEWYHHGVHYCLENGLMVGFEDNLFAPNGTTTRAQLVTILWRMEGRPMVETAEGFNDVYETDWYNNAVRWATANGIVKGYGDGFFGPSDTVTREQVISILWRYAQYRGIDVSAGEDTNILSYGDVFDISEYAVPAMQWACGSDVVNGMEDMDGTLILDPQGSTTRAQMSTMMMRYCEEIAK